MNKVHSITQMAMVHINTMRYGQLSREKKDKLITAIQQHSQFLCKSSLVPVSAWKQYPKHVGLLCSSKKIY
jgi:hypothetical protein